MAMVAPKSFQKTIEGNPTLQTLYMHFPTIIYYALCHAPSLLWVRPSAILRRPHEFPPTGAPPAAILCPPEWP